MKPFTRSIIAALCLVSVAVSRCGGSHHTISPLTITPVVLPNGTLGAVYSQTIQAGGGVAPFAWAVSAGTLPNKLIFAPGVGNTATISGTPDTAAQAVAFTIKITDSANQSATQSYTVSILAEPDTLSFSPAAGLSFSPQLVGTVSTTQSATLTNTGSSPVVINSVAAGGDFSQSNTCGSSLAAGSNCTISATFTPSQLGPRNASITISDSTVGSPHSVSLSGVGLTSGPNATLSATSLTFGNQVVGTTSPAQSITLSNYGTTTLSIASTAVTPNFGETDTCSGSSLASGANCTIHVTFTPSASGSLSGTISVADNAPGSPQTVSLSGTGTTSNYTLTGYCLGNFPGTPLCQQTKDLTECPAGQRATSPGFVRCLQGGVVSVDASRACHSSPRNGGECVTMFNGGAGSGAAASGSLR